MQFTTYDSGSLQVSWRDAGNKTLRYLKHKISRTVRRDEGSSIIELAIVFPILLLLFISTAELGRLFYTYTTLAKATKTGARYLSTSRKVVNGTSQDIIDEKRKTRNLVVCGVTSIVATACSNQVPIVRGLTTANVSICDNFSVPCNPVIPAGPIKYFRVEIANYNYSAGVFNLATATGKTSTTFYFPLKPSTEMRYMP